MSHWSKNNARYCSIHTYSSHLCEVYGRVTGQCVNGLIHTFGIVHKFKKKRADHVLSPPLNDSELQPLSISISLFYSLLLFAFQLFFSFSSLCASHSAPSLPCLSLLALPSSFRNSHLFLSLSLSLDGTTESRPPKLMTIITL